MLSNTAIQIYDDLGEMAEAAADLIVDVGQVAVEQRGRFLLALSGGGTPEATYGLLAGQDRATRLDWRAAHVFWGDERNVPADAPGSNYGQARRLLLDHVPTPDEQIHRIRGELAPDEAAADYRQLLARMAADELAWPRLDMALMGLGADGHTASLFPGPAAAGEERLAAIAVTADYGGRPAERVSLTPAVFNSARNVIFLATGASKAEAVAAVLQGAADPERWPAARIRPESGRVVWLVDWAAAALLL
jgi:6-phosphogluconolactonase